jgi:hypothetical protein
MGKRLHNTSTLVVVGEGLAAGVGHFSLTEDVQPWSFPAQAARQLELRFHQAVMEAPGLGNVHHRQMPAIVPDLLQSSVRKDFPGDAFELNDLSVPGFTARDARTMTPRPPLVHRRDAKQTLVNFILGLPALTEKDGELLTQLEIAARRKPDVAVVELGYHELLELCVQGYQHSGDRMDLPTFEADYDEIVRTLAATGAAVVATTIPDPIHTAYFSTLATAATILRTEPAFLRKQYNLRDDDLITVPGLIDVGFQLTARQITGSIEDGGVMHAADASNISRAAARLNESVATVAARHSARVYDLGGFLAKVARDGITVGARRFTSRFLDGFYLLNGVYPGRTAHALIANDFIVFLNGEFGTSGAAVDVDEVLSDDGNALARLAPGATATEAFLVPRTRAEIPRMPPADPSLINVFPPFDPNKFNLFPIQTIYPELDPKGTKKCCEPAKGIPAGGYSHPNLAKPLVLPEGLEQTLPINKEWSYFGDALRAVDAPHDPPFLPAFPSFGASGNTLFGGLAMTDSHLEGELHIKFSEPDARNVTRFEVYHPGGLVGDDGVLAAPLFFRLPSQLNTITDVPGLVSSGELNLDTGVVTNFHYRVSFMNTAIMTLFGVNPKLPKGPMVFPGPPNAGSTWARFEQRDNGTLDFTCAANMFLPLGITFGGEMIRFPLPFATPDLQCASIAARCLSLHPHIHISTRPSSAEPTPARVPNIPVNTVEEFTPFVYNTSFGDVFGLHIDELGGAGTGRAHLMGRVKIQFGPRFGNSVSFAIQFLPPGGLCAKHPEPLPYLPPGTSRGMISFNEQMRFPSGVTYNQSKLSSASDPFRMALGAIDLRTGRVIGEFLHPGFVVQQLFVNLMSVEPCTPADTFNYQGPAVFEADVNGQITFRFNGEVFIPYPKGFHFPAPTPDGTPAFVVVEESRLDPFVRVRAMSGGAPGQGVFQGEETKARSSIGKEFSYRYSLPLDPTQPGATFEYTNHSESGTFTLTALSWFSPSYSRGSKARAGEPDTVTFGGFGRWSEDAELHQVSVHISTVDGARYVGILIDGGVTSNVNTKPADMALTMP